MLSELQSAASMSSPKDLDLRLQREMVDVFGPQPVDPIERRDSVGCLGERWTWKPPKAPESELGLGSTAPSSRRSTRSERRSESARLGGLALLARPQNEERRATSAEPCWHHYTSPTARNSRREAGTSSLNQAARSMLHC